MMWNIFNRNPIPFNQGYLPKRDGHSIYFMEYGNPQGIPVLSFHGGPGGSAKAKYAKLFNLKKYHFIQFDQRGCGLSKAENIFFRNETSYTIKDALHLLAYLHISGPIIVHGASWGSTLALLFAQAHPKLIKKIVVTSVFLARRYDEEWMNKESERFYPDLWQEMRDQINCQEIQNEYLRLLFSNRKRDYLKAMSYLGSYEYMLGQISPKFTLLKTVEESSLKAARIFFHYAKNNYFISENQILNNVKKIKGIPTLIVHNRMDFCCPLKQAWDLYRNLPKSKLIINPDYGHSSPKMTKRVKSELKLFL